jgi:hypothetical protein
MAQLNLLPPLVNASQQNFNAQVYQGFTSLQSWCPTTLTNKDIDYIQSNNQNVQQNNWTTTSTDYKSVPNFTFNFKPLNQYVDIRFQLTLQGTGYVGLFVNSQVLRELPFFCGTFNQVGFSFYEQFTTTQTQVAINIRSTSGLVTLAQTKLQPFFNRFQAYDVNS